MILKIGSEKVVIEEGADERLILFQTYQNINNSDELCFRLVKNEIS